jgi:hypothetical protein
MQVGHLAKNKGDERVGNKRLLLLESEWIRRSYKGVSRLSDIYVCVHIFRKHLLACARLARPVG